MVHHALLSGQKAVTEISLWYVYLLLRQTVNIGNLPEQLALMDAYLAELAHLPLPVREAVRHLHPIAVPALMVHIILPEIVTVTHQQTADTLIAVTNRQLPQHLFLLIHARIQLMESM